MPISGSGPATLGAADERDPVGQPERRALLAEDAA